VPPIFNHPIFRGIKIAYRNRFLRKKFRIEDLIFWIKNLIFWIEGSKIGFEGPKIGFNAQKSESVRFVVWGPRFVILDFWFVRSGTFLRLFQPLWTSHQNHRRCDFWRRFLLGETKGKKVLPFMVIKNSPSFSLQNWSQNSATDF
jgi:hypothetical protein